MALVIACVLSLLLVACGSDGGGDGAQSPAGDETATSAGDAETEAASPAASEAEPTAVKFATSSHSMTAGPVLAALSLDTFSDNALDVEEVAMNGSSSQALAALLSGDTQFAFLGGTSAFDARAEGAPVVVLGPTATSLLTMALSTDTIDVLTEDGVTPDSSIEERVDALRGLTIATSPPGSLSHTLLLTMLEQYGVAESDLQIVPSDPGAMVAGIKEGLYDGVFWPVGVMEQAYADGDAGLWISFPAGDVPPIPNYMQGVVVTTEDVVSQSPEVVDAFRQSIIDANTMITGDEEETAKEAVKAFAFDAVDQPVFDEQWSVAKGAWIPEFTVSQELFDTAKELQELTGEGDYADVTFDTLIAESARTS